MWSAYKTEPVPDLTDCFALMDVRHACLSYAVWLTPLCWLAACQSLPAPEAPTSQTAPQSAPQTMACPAVLPAATRCLSGTDSEGAHYVIAVPAAWSGVLVLHAHGGPELGLPKLERSVEDLKRWSVMVKAGHAWAGSTFRQSGVAVRAAAEDTERDEAQYPLWMGLPAGAHLSRSELAARADECLGLRLPAAERSAEQLARVRTIVQVVRIPERSIQGHLNWATWHFQDIVQRRTGGLNPFGNAGALYAGSSINAALNAGVLRYRADPEGVRRFGADTDPNGRIGVPVLSVHGINDPTVFVEVDSVFQATMQRAGTAEHLVQTFTDDNQHSYLSDPVYATLVEAFVAVGWARGEAHASGHRRALPAARSGVRAGLPVPARLPPRGARRAHGRAPAALILRHPTGRLLGVGALQHGEEGVACLGLTRAVLGVVFFQFVHLAITADPALHGAPDRRGAGEQCAQAGVAGVFGDVVCEFLHVGLGAFDQLAEALAVEQQRTSDTVRRVVQARSGHDLFDDLPGAAGRQPAHIEKLKRFFSVIHRLEGRSGLRKFEGSEYSLRR